MKIHRILPAIIFFLLFIPDQIKAEDRTDSLRQAVAADPGSRRAADNLVSLAQDFLAQHKKDSAEKYTGLALELSTRLNYYEGLAESNYLIYRLMDRSGNYQEASIYVRRFIAMCEEKDDLPRVVKGYYSYGYILGNQGKKDSAIYYIQKSRSILDKKDTLRLLAINNALGNIYNDLSDHDSAAFYFLHAAQLAEAAGQLKYLGPIYNNLGRTFTNLKDYDKARHYLDISLEINEKNNDLKYIVQNFQNISANELQAGNTDKALQALDKAAEIMQSLQDVIETANLYNNYASIYQRQEKYELALENYKKALPLFRSQDYAEGIIMALKNIGEMYIQLDRYDMAQAVLDSALQMATRAGYLKNRRLILQDMAFNYGYQGNYKMAYEYYKMYHNLYDSLLNLDKVKAINELEKKYQKEKDQAKILTLEKENLKKTLQRNIVLYTASAIISLALFSLLYFRQRAKKDRIISQQKIRQLEEEQKLMVARLLVEGQEVERKRIAQELHDGLGVILSATKLQFTSIRDLTPENQPLLARATQLLEQASGDVRRISHNMMPGLLTRLGLYEALEDLFDSLDEMKGMHAAIEIEGDKSRLPENKEIMLYRVVQEMVNNTLKHAKAENISLKIARTADELSLIYSDDGTGFDAGEILAAPTESLGLKGIKSRIGFLSGEVKIESSPGKGVKFSIRVPV